MEITEFFGSDRKKHWLGQLGKCRWSAGKLLKELIETGTAEQQLGGGLKVFMLTDGDKLVSFCTFSERDDIPDCELTPWIGFVYTFPEYRGHRYAGKLIRHAENAAYKAGFRNVYISTDHTGLYEKYGYAFFETRKDMNGSDSRIYKKEPENGECQYTEND